MNTDLIIVCGVYSKRSEDNLSKVIESLDKQKFKNKYILFDGCSTNEGPCIQKDKYIKYKNSYKVHYPDFQFIESSECNYYKKNLQLFIKDNFEALAKNLFVIQDDIILDDFDLEKVLNSKAVFDECRILYFREHRLRCNHWFNIIEDKQDLLKTHGWNEKVYLTDKKHLVKILDILPNDIKFTKFYYDNLMKDKTWETITEKEQLDFWNTWGCYEHKTIHHKHLSTKRNLFT